MNFKSKYNTGDKVKAESRGNIVETKIVGITATEVIETEQEIKRSSCFYTLECQRERNYEESELAPIEAVKPAEKISEKVYDEVLDAVKTDKK